MALTLGCGALLVAEATNAQPRSEPEVSRTATLPVTDPSAIAEWLGRLVGKFKYDGAIEDEAISGSSDCVGIGDGPGVHCILNVTWIDQYPVPYEEGKDYHMVSYLDPAMELFGLDPGKSAISHLVVNNKGLPEQSFGFIKGDMATFKTRCVNTSVDEPCFRVVIIDARRDSDLLWMWFGKTDNEYAGDISYYATMTLRRMPPDWEGAPARRKK